MSKVVTIRLDEEIIKELDFYAKELESSRAFLIKKAISSYLDSLDEIISDERIEKIKSGKVKPLQLEEVFKKAEIDISE